MDVDFDIKCTLTLRVNLCTPSNFEHLAYIIVCYFQVIILHYEYRTLKKFMFSHDFETSVTTV